MSCHGILTFMACGGRFWIVLLCSLQLDV